MERGHLQDDPAPHLPDRGGDGPPRPPELAKAFPGDQGKIDYMALIGDNQVRMANICAYTANSINGVSKLHSEIIKESVFHDYYLFKPNAFKNVTNGIAYRRWLLASTPACASCWTRPSATATSTMLPI